MTTRPANKDVLPVPAAASTIWVEAISVSALKRSPPSAIVVMARSKTAKRRSRRYRRRDACVSRTPARQAAPSADRLCFGME
ncbi:hypothetical protein ACVWWO_005195 [Bradyrhizobium sp. F1.13.1]